MLKASRVSFPTDTYVEFSGTAEAQAQSRRDLLVNSLLAALGIVLLLSVVMRNQRNLLLVLLNLPLALVGGVLVALLTGASLSLGSLVGFVTLFGITLRNSIMLISHELGVGHRSPWRFRTPRTNLDDGFGHETRPFTLAIGSGDPGREIEGPMATVILGGLVTSTLLNLLVLPTLALRYGRFESGASVLTTRIIMKRIECTVCALSLDRSAFRGSQPGVPTRGKLTGLIPR
jgi:predicted exporter